VTKLQSNDDIGIPLATRGSPDDSYFVGVKVRGGEVLGRVQAIDPVHGAPGCLHLQAARRLGHPNGQGPSAGAGRLFGNSDLSRILITTELGVRGKNHVSYMTGWPSTGIQLA
jgi:hypothetical protein